MAERKKQALARGLDDIFGADVSGLLEDIQSNGKDAPGRREVEIGIAEIRPNPYQPRKEFEPKALNELADSIRQHGIFTPLLVRRGIHGYELIAGERRLRAAKIAGLGTVPAISVDFTDDQMMEISLLENVQREDLNPIEEAAAYDALVKRLGYTQEKLAERVGKSREYCANMLRMLKLPQEVQEMVIQKKLTMGHVRPLLGLKDEGQMYDAAQYILAHKMSVREVADYVKTLADKPVRREKIRKPEDPQLADLEHRISEKLGTRVTVGKKQMVVRYTNTKDLNRILEILNLIEED